MVTPFDQNGNVDYEQAKRLAIALLDSGSDGVVVAGTTVKRQSRSDNSRNMLRLMPKS